MNLLANCGIVLLFLILIKQHLLPQREMVYEYSHLFNIVNIFVLMIYMIFFGFQLSFMRSEYIVLIDGMLLCLWLYLLYTMNRTFILSEEKTELVYREIYNQNVEQYVQYYLQDQEKLSELKHDFKNHLMIIERLDDFQKIHEYIEEILGDIQNMQSYETYGNIYVDACLNMKVQEYKDVQFHFSIHIDGLKMNGKDLSALLFNLLDNSAHAASQCQGEVDMSMIYNEGNLVMSMKNDCLFKPDFQSHNQYHGYGMRIIQSIVDKYNGAIEYRFEQQKVCVDLCIQV